MAVVGGVSLQALTFWNSDHSIDILQFLSGMLSVSVGAGVRNLALHGDVEGKVRQQTRIFQDRVNGRASQLRDDFGIPQIKYDPQTQWGTAESCLLDAASAIEVGIDTAIRTFDVYFPPEMHLSKRLATAEKTVWKDAGERLDDARRLGIA